MPPRMIPSTLKEFDFKEPGEQRVFELLKGLSSDCFVWYEVVLGVRSRKPDFFILDPHRGIKILEVKDWGKSTILGASPTMVKIKTKNNKVQRQKNPGRKCLVYIDEASEKLEIDPVLIGKHDRLVFPIDYLIVFPNLSRNEFHELKLREFLDEEHILFKDEVKKPSLFMGKMQESGDRLKEPLTYEMITSVRTHLREDVTIDSPGGGMGLLPGILPEGEIELAEELHPDVFAIDMEQEELAKELGDGPRLMRGIAGTGKTLIMLIRAKLLASNMEQQGKPVKILVLCWNVSLANYMRQAFDHINIPLKGYVPIIHFAEFARQLVNSHVESPRFPRASDPEFEDKITQRLKKLKITSAEKYDYIIIDEAQDFQDEWIKFIFDKMVKGTDPKKKNLVMAADDAQKVYKSRDFSWEALGIPMRGDRSTILRKIYRNSPRIWGFAAFLLRDIAKYYDDNPDLRFSIKRGVDPKLIECKTIDQQIDECIREIKNIGESGYSWRNVLILYHRTRTYDGYQIVDRLISHLKSENISYQWITESMDAKNTFRWGEDSVKISTAASAKGLDAPKVIILNAESFGVREEPEYDELKMMYVSLTRAREELVILHTGNGGLVPELQRCMKMFKKYKSRLIKMEEAGN